VNSYLALLVIKAFKIAINIKYFTYFAYFIEKSIYILHIVCKIYVYFFLFIFFHRVPVTCTWWYLLQVLFSDQIANIYRIYHWWYSKLVNLPQARAVFVLPKFCVFVVFKIKILKRVHCPKEKISAQTKRTYSILGSLDFNKKSLSIPYCLCMVYDFKNGETFCAYHHSKFIIIEYARTV
jgi:hypothetical protein